MHGCVSSIGLNRPYRWAIVVGGFSAPLFLFLAGVVMALATGSPAAKGAEDF